MDYTGRIAKWGTVLRASDIKYMPHTSVKGQVLANLMAEFAEPPLEEMAATQSNSRGLRSGASSGRYILISSNLLKWLKRALVMLGPSNLLLRRALTTLGPSDLLLRRTLAMSDPLESPAKCYTEA